MSRRRDLSIISALITLLHSESLFVFFLFLKFKGRLWKSLKDCRDWREGCAQGDWHTLLCDQGWVKYHSPRCFWRESREWSCPRNRLCPVRSHVGVTFPSGVVMGITLASSKHTDLSLSSTEDVACSRNWPAAPSFSLLGKEKFCCVVQEVLLCSADHATSIAFR